jgi:uncharacterized protein involved in response to NO
MKKLAPYQIFFPLGFLNALLAVGVWFVQDLGWFSSPAIFIHSRLIVGGFLWSFITGFLMTAIPRMTGTSSAHKAEYFIAAVLLLGQTFFAWQISAKYFYANQILLIGFLVIYGGRRIVKMKKPLPVFFSHIGAAMLLAIAGSWYHFNGNSFMGIHLYHLGATLLLVLGIGTRFFSFLSGLPSDFEAATSSALRWMFHASAVLICALLVLAGKGYAICYLGLALLSLVYLFGIWRVQRASTRPSALKWAVRTAAAVIPFGFFMTWLQPLMFVTWFHLMFISCFAMLTFSVATRVTLAHGSYTTDLEMKSRALGWLVGLLILGTFFRLLYGYSEGLWRISWLHSAATCWVFALLCWGWAFLPRIFKKGPQDKASC